MKRNTLLAAALLLVTTTFAQSWSVDKVHSKLGFGITNLGILEFTGGFKKFDAKISGSKADFSDAAVELTADVNSIDTYNEQRDNHLKSPDFFDAAKYPTITFKSQSFKKTGDKTYAVAGDLTFHGVTKPVTLTATLNGTGVHPQSKKDIAGFTVTGTFKRSDFGFAPGMPTAALSDEVKVIGNTLFTKD
jgi:polyisoprenoid-binding protein YceI